MKASYLAGQPGFQNAMYAEDGGRLELASDRLRFYARKRGIHVTSARELKFEIPLSQITVASNTIDRNGPNAAAVAMLGTLGLGSKRQDEYVYLTTETSVAANVVIFKVAKNTSAALVAKIEFAKRQAVSSK